MNRVKDNQKVSGQDLLQFCLQQSSKNGSVMDATRFRNELQMRFYGEDTKALFELGIAKKFYFLKAGNVLFLVNGRKMENDKEIKDEDLREFCRWCRFRGNVSEDVLVTCLCGHFHSFPDVMKQQLKRMVSLGLITVNKDKTYQIG